MAGYREFHVEPIYAAPDIGILERGLVSGARSSAEAIGNIFRSISEQQRAKRAAADQYKFDLGEGKFENDDKIFFQKGLNFTQRGKESLRSDQRISPELEKDMITAIQEKKQSDWQFKKFEQNEKEISTREKDDKYYDGSADRQANKLAAYGENNDVYYATRGERLEAFEKVKGKLPGSLKGKLYTADYVKTFGKKEKTAAFGDPNYESTTYDASPFLTPQGTPGVTIDHAKEYLNSRPDGSVARWVEHLVDQQMDADVKYNKSHNEKLKGMSDDEVKLYLKANPRENLYNQKDYASRVIEKAQDELLEASSIARKTDYQSKVDKSVTGGLYENDTIGHSYTTHQDEAVQTQSGTGFKGEFAYIPKEPQANNMPGGILRIGKGMKVGQAIPLELNPRFTYNIRTGANQESRGTTAFNLTGYQTAAYSNDGKLQPLDIQKLDSLPNSAFKNLQPNLGVSLRGYTLDKGNTLGELAAKQSQLDDEFNDAVMQDRVEDQLRIQRQIASLDSLKQKMNLSTSEFSEEDLLSALKQTGVATTSIRKDVLLKASQSDIDLINKNVTRGFNLNDKAKWSTEMIEADRAYQERYQKAAAAGFKDPETKADPIKKSKAAKVPSGNVKVVSPDGRSGYVPASQLMDALEAGYKQVE